MPTPRMMLDAFEDDSYPGAEVEDDGIGGEDEYEPEAIFPQMVW